MMAVRVRLSSASTSPRAPLIRPASPSFRVNRTVSPALSSIGCGAKVWEIGRAHVWTPVTNAHRVCRLLLEKKKVNYTKPKNHNKTTNKNSNDKEKHLYNKTKPNIN